MKANSTANQPKKYGINQDLLKQIGDGSLGKFIRICGCGAPGRIFLFMDFGAGHYLYSSCERNIGYYSVSVYANSIISCEMLDKFLQSVQQHFSEMNVEHVIKIAKYPKNAIEVPIADGEIADITEIEIKIANAS